MTYGADMNIPNTYAGYDHENVPDGHSAEWVEPAELHAAGFHGGPEALPEHKPGTAPASELLITGSSSMVVGPDEAATILAAGRALVLRDPDESIVATWDEGRWWTREESDAFTAAIVAELKSST